VDESPFLAGNASSGGACAYWERCRLRDLGEQVLGRQTAWSVILLTAGGSTAGWGAETLEHLPAEP
jgi:hypothetical protein